MGARPSRAEANLRQWAEVYQQRLFFVQYFKAESEKCEKHAGLACQYVSYLITSPQRQTTKFGLVLVHAPHHLRQQETDRRHQRYHGRTVIESQVERKSLLPLDWNQDLHDSNLNSFLVRTFSHNL